MMMHTLEPLNSRLIRSAMSVEATPHLKKLVILKEISSTNDYLLTQEDACSGWACLAEHQTAGRGRHGRSWISPFGHNIYLSLLWELPNGVKQLEGLSLVVGIIVASVLQRYGVTAIGLKWPNDLYYQQQKVGGILVDITRDAHHTCKAVIGIGLNLALSEADTIDQPWTDLQTILGKQPPRNAIAGTLLQELLIALPLFNERGFSAFIEQWQHFDVLQSQRVTVYTPHGETVGYAAGVNASGHLRIDCQGTLHYFNSADVSVRQTR